MGRGYQEATPIVHQNRLAVNWWAKLEEPEIMGTIIILPNFCRVCLSVNVRNLCKRAPYFFRTGPDVVRENVIRRARL